MAHPTYGHRLLASVLDELAYSQPDKRCMIIPNGSKAEEGFRDISYSALAQAINYCAWNIEHELGRGQNFPTIGYMGPQDARYLILLLACNKTGYKLFVPSPRNTIEAHLCLLETLNCNVFFLPDGPPAILKIVKQIQSQRQLIELAMQPLKDLLDLQNVPLWRYDESFESAINKPWVVLHTSGSTGMPKPIILTHRSITSVDAMQRPEYSSTLIASWKDRVSFLPFPLFHAAGILLLSNSIYANMTTVFPPSGPLTAQLVDSVHQLLNIQLSLLPPSILADIAANPDFLERLRKIPLVGYGGGPIPTAAGNQIALRTHLHTSFGSTEYGQYALDLLSKDDWQWLRFNSAMGAEMCHFMDDFYELRLHRKPELKDLQAIFAIYPGIDVYDTNDLFTKHPTKEGLWKFHGRRDDVIVYGTGEKMNPISMEDLINGHLDVSAALIYGHGRVQSALMLELQGCSTETKDQSPLIEKIWPTIQEANKICPSYGRIIKEMILLVTSEKPLPRAGKGTVQRRMAYEIYQDELDLLYDRLETNTIAGSKKVSVGKVVSDVPKKDQILDVVRSLDGFSSFNLQTSLHDHGIDSQQVATLLSRLRGITPQLGIPSDLVKMSAIYESKTVEELANRLLENNFNSKTTEEYMQDVFAAYTEELPISARRPDNQSPNRRTVLLTGSTGTLGKYLLDQLISDPDVEKIYCLGRGKDLELRQRHLMVENGLESNFAKHRLVFLHCDLSKPYLGLSLSTYHDLLEEITFIIHNAWTVDFNQSLDRISSVHVKGVKQLLQFSVQSKHGASLFFISSISSVSRWQAKSAHESFVPERVSRSWSDAAETGYSQSKNVAERVIDSACSLTKMSAAICRVGQIAGPTTKHGCWPKQEWLPTLIASSKYLGKMPSDLSALGPIDWVPVDSVASTILSLCKHSTSSDQNHSSGEPSVYHIVNPNQTAWSDLLPVIQNTLKLEVIPSSHWLQLLVASSQSSATSGNPNPGHKLVDFFVHALQGRFRELSAPIGLDHTIQACPQFASIGPVNEHLMQLWLQQWAF